jgi:hypothetical protein
MYYETEIVSYLLNHFNIRQYELAEYLDVTESTVSRRVVDTSLEKIHHNHREKVMDFFEQNYEVSRKIFNTKHQNEEEFKKIFLDAKENKDTTKNEILNLLVGSWYLYSKKSNSNEIYYWKVQINENETFFIDRTDIETIFQKEYGKVLIEKNAILLHTLDLRTNNDFLTFHITKTNIRKKVYGLMVGRNINTESYHSAIFILSKEKMILSDVSEILQSDTQATHVFENLDLRKFEDR